VNVAKGKKQKNDSALEKARQYDRDRRRMDALENGSGGIRKRSEDW
jgi:hypothetical protein